MKKKNFKWKTEKAFLLDIKVSQMSQIKIKAPSTNGSNKLFYCKFESVISLLRSTLFSYKNLKRLGL